MVLGLKRHTYMIELFTIKSWFSQLINPLFVYEMVKREGDPTEIQQKVHCHSFLVLSVLQKTAYKRKSNKFKEIRELFVIKCHCVKLDFLCPD